MATSLAYGTRHAWSSIKTFMLGRTVEGITSIEYGHKQNKVNNYGAGVNPVSRGRGRIEPSAKITLHSWEVDAIQAALPPGKDLTDIEPFDIVVTYLPEGQDTLKTDYIRNAEFTGVQKSVKEGDTSILMEFELIVSHIERT